ncbi:nitroreductase family protein [Caloramator sp. mosi_1]|uniref:nitroreductase family protein n=1 Tax=Caloramator sp. mosi_1 TaxID=3023090 RepID=UPI0023623A32|nr:nitroreductase family protein [Caloramator sp. mosi_1]WDC85340.1 nitroreductase family protein [Caloramator sp. mosi_1]
MEVIFKRRSIRRYQDKEVEKEKIEKLLRAAMQAPSAGNQRPWEFIVVKDKAILEKLSSVSPYSKMIAKANLAIVLLCNKKYMKYPEYWQQDIAAATQNLLLEAVYLGLGAVWLGIAPLKERMEYVKGIFNLPENIDVFSIVPVGYPLEENKFVDRYEENRVKFDRYE